MMYSSRWKTAVFVGINLLSTASSILAQIVPDQTLPNNTVVTPNGNTFQIEGGTRAGSNLFHSFKEFSLPTVGTAFFNNALDVKNIFSRVTGGNISHIDGLIRANGIANLFLLNPNGIIFGSNARLNIGGSFIGSTANSIRFADGNEFSAVNPQAPPLLTINVPIGLQFGSNPAPIVNQSQAANSLPLPPVEVPIPIPSNVGLQVLPGETLALIGGDISLNNGNLTAFQGNVFLGSVVSSGLVRFVSTPNGLGFDYTGIENFGNIELSGTASVTTSGFGGGAIQVRGGNVTLRDRSNLVSDTIGNFDGRGIEIEATYFKLTDRAFVGTSTIGQGAGGNLTIRTKDAIELVGIGFNNLEQVFIEVAANRRLDTSLRAGGLFTGTDGVGRAGNITIDTRQLRLNNGAFIISPSFGLGAGGTIMLRASESIDISASGVSTTAFNQGDAGTLTIDTGKLTLRDQAIASTATFGAGNGGNLLVTAKDSVVLSEQQETSLFGTNLSTSTVGGTGAAGNLEINTRSLLVESGATITSSSGATATNQLIPSAGKGGNIVINATDSVTVTGTSVGIPPSRSQVITATLGSADSGNLTINTGRLTIADGGGVGASTVGAGRGGNVSINASSGVEIAGQTINGVSSSSIATASGDALLASFFPGQLNPTGAAGNLTIITPRLVIRDQGSVSVGSVGSGQAGTIEVIANAIALNNQGIIDGITGSGAGGNINLQAQNIQLRGNSRIRTDAGASDGGNISLNTDTLVALENSDISANALVGRGGRVNINAQAIFGAQVRSQPTRQSDITATGGTPALSGTVQINTPEVKPAVGLVQLPENFTDIRERIADSCLPFGGSRFVVTGRGGLPEDPRQPLRSQVVVQDFRTAGEENLTNLGNQNATASSQIVEATGWSVNDRSQVELVAKSNERSLWQRSVNCGELQRYLH
jgi:filamentous hemagglutinin family protein